MKQSKDSTPPPATLLALLQLASPALPVGGFAYSQGLESAIDEGRVHDAASAQCWIDDLLMLVIARFEAPVWLRIHAATRAGDEAAITRWNRDLLATRGRQNCAPSHCKWELRCCASSLRCS